MTKYSVTKTSVSKNSILCLDIGNTNLYGGVFEAGNLTHTFRRDTHSGCTADELGIFFRTVLKENNFDPAQISAVGISSVVPSIIHSLRGAIIKYFNCEPFILKAGVKTGLKVTIRNPLEVGSDRIANAIAGVHKYPNKNLIIVDFGTATTFCAISKQSEYLGGVIIPGVKISMEALEAKTARLPKVEIVKPESALGRSTIEAIQAGLYYSTVGGIKEVCEQLSLSCFKAEERLIIGTGGFSALFRDQGLFDVIAPDLVLDGIRIALERDQNNRL
jgi:type III pantothenate kinase